MHQVMNSGRRLSAAAALVFAAILAISLFGLAGCSAAEPKDDTSAASTSDESVPEHAATEEGDEPIEGASMNSVFEVGTDDAAKSVEAVGDKSPNAGLSWSGVMGVSIEDACLYQSFAAAQEANAGLELEKDADESGAVLVCKVLVENDSAVDASGSDLFKADFLYLNSDRIPVTSCVPQDAPLRADPFSTSSFRKVRQRLLPWGSQCLKLGGPTRRPTRVAKTEARLPMWPTWPSGRAAATGTRPRASSPSTPSRGCRFTGATRRCRAARLRLSRARTAV